MLSGALCRPTKPIMSGGAAGGDKLRLHSSRLSGCSATSLLTVQGLRWSAPLSLDTTLGQEEFDVHPESLDAQEVVRRVHVIKSLCREGLVTWFSDAGGAGRGR